MSEFLPLRTKLKRAGTGEEDNFVPPYFPATLAAARDSREDFEKVTCMHASGVLRGHVTTSAFSSHICNQPIANEVHYTILLLEYQMNL